MFHKLRADLSECKTGWVKLYKVTDPPDTAAVSAGTWLHQMCPSFQATHIMLRVAQWIEWKLGWRHGPMMIFAEVVSSLQWWRTTSLPENWLHRSDKALKHSYIHPKRSTWVILRTCKKQRQLFVFPQADWLVRGSIIHSQHLHPPHQLQQIVF